MLIAFLLTGCYSARCERPSGTFTREVQGRCALRSYRGMNNSSAIQDLAEVSSDAFSQSSPGLTIRSATSETRSDARKQVVITVSCLVVSVSGNKKPRD